MIISRVHICTALQKNTTLKILNFSSCGITDLVAESLARALEVNSTLEELNIIDDYISDNGMAHIVKSLQRNNTLKSLHAGIARYSTVFTDTAVLSLARCVATNTSIEHLSIPWSSNDPESTLKMMAKSVKNSNLKTLAPSMWVLPPRMCVPVQEGTIDEKARKWFHGLEVGGKELILSLEDSHLKLFEMRLPEPSYHGCSLEFQTVVDSVSTARQEKGLPSIYFSIASI